MAAVWKKGKFTENVTEGFTATEVILISVSRGYWIGAISILAISNIGWGAMPILAMLAISNIGWGAILAISNIGWGQLVKFNQVSIGATACKHF